MSIVSNAALASVGFIADIRPDLLPIAAFSDARNVRFRQGSVQAIKGEFNIYQAPSVEPYFAIQFKPVGEVVGWVYCGLTKIYAFQEGTNSNLTRQTASVDVNYTALATSRWNGGTLNNVIVLNNGQDVPQSWTSLDTSVRMQDLANWPSTWRAECIRPFKNFLLALDVTESSVRYPTRLRWSHPADPGTVPVSWDETDVTKDAGETPVGNSFGKLVDAVPLRDSMVLYKEDSVYLLSYIGGTFIFKVIGLFQNFGMPARDCAVEFKPGQHIVFTGSDLLVHDGQTSQSLLEERAKTWLARVDKTKISQCFVVADPQHEEVMFCYPTADRVGGYGGLVQEAIIWNWRLNVLSYRDLRKTNFIVNGVFDSSQFLDDAWDSAIGTWPDETIPWDISGAFIGTRQLTFCLSTPALAMGNFGYLADALPFQTRLARSGIGFPVHQQTLPDVTSMKFLRGVWPRFTGGDGETVQIRIGWQRQVDQAIEWGLTQDFVIGTSFSVYCTVSARTFAIEVSSYGVFPWTLSSIDFDASPAGKL